VGEGCGATSHKVMGFHFLTEGPDEMAFADLLYQQHPLFHQNDTAVNPSVQRKKMISV
jgi:hypothetical protein